VAVVVGKPFLGPFPLAGTEGFRAAGAFAETRKNKHDYDDDQGQREVNHGPGG
jgi:hypothetical protein